MSDVLESPAFLIVEDERVLALDLRRTLERKGFRVAATAYSGADAMSAAELSPPDVVLMDLRLNGPMDGIATALALRSRFEFALVYITGAVDVGDTDNQQRLRASRPSGWLSKPFTDTMLDDVVSTALASLRPRP